MKETLQNYVDWICLIIETVFLTGLSLFIIVFIIFSIIENNKAREIVKEWENRKDK